VSKEGGVLRSETWIIFIEKERKSYRRLQQLPELGRFSFSSYCWSGGQTSFKASSAGLRISHIHRELKGHCDENCGDKIKR